MKLEVGMYVRLQNDVEDIVIINRIANVFENTILTENDGSIYQGEYTKENVVKASYNIIDILEENDYVNGSKVVNINYDLNYDEDIVESITIFDYSIEGNEILHNEEIKSIVTHEQMEQMAYKVEC